MVAILIATVTRNNIDVVMAAFFNLFLLIFKFAGP
jgi:hypothetical protein